MTTPPPSTPNPQPAAQPDPGSGPPAGVNDWKDYFDAVAGLPPRETLLIALDRFGTHASGEPKLAVDLGCGDGRDTVELLRRGWRVLALDSAPAGLDRLRARVQQDPALARLAHHLEIRLGSYEDHAWPVADLVNASFSIPHCREGSFNHLWQRLAASIRPGGRFAGQLFGVRDSWSRSIPPHHLPPEPAPDSALGFWRDGRQFHTRAEVDALLHDFDLVPEHLDEVCRLGKTAMGDPKFWHVFHIVARKD